MDPITGSALITAGAGLFGGLFDSGSNYKIAKQNLQLQRDVFDWQKNVQTQTWNREDNAVQRRAADLKAAGFNPLLAAGGAASSGQAVSVTSPQNNYRSEIGAQMLAAAKAASDISMTRSQQQLLNEQVRAQNKQNELTQMTIDWYKDHPGYAPGIESGFHTGKGLSSILDAVSNRLSVPSLTKTYIENNPKRDYKPGSLGDRLDRLSRGESAYRK